MTAVTWTAMLARALHRLYPVSDDIATWDVSLLDELGVWQATVDGAEVIEAPPLVDLPLHGGA